jgi:hypothetical protein
MSKVRKRGAIPIMRSATRYNTLGIGANSNAGVNQQKGAKLGTKLHPSFSCTKSLFSQCKCECVRIIPMNYSHVFGAADSAVCVLVGLGSGGANFGPTAPEL